MSKLTLSAFSAPLSLSVRAVFALPMIMGAAVAYAGQAFKCHVNSFDQSVNEWVLSQPMVGHGMQHFAMKSFVVKTSRFEFDANSNIFSPTDVTIRISNSGFTAISKNHLIFAPPNAPELHVDCENQ